jgi:hypothetical protein
VKPVLDLRDVKAHSRGLFSSDGFQSLADTLVWGKVGWKHGWTVTEETISHLHEFEFAGRALKRGDLIVGVVIKDGTTVTLSESMKGAKLAKLLGDAREFMVEEYSKELVRRARQTRYTVASKQASAEGLYFTGLAGGQARLEPPQNDWRTSSPSLFLSVADGIQEFFQSKELSQAFGELGVEPDPEAMADRSETGHRFVHMSRFVTDDRDSDGDLPPKFLDDAVRALGKEGFVWHPDGYYDKVQNMPGASFRTQEVVTSDELLRRARVAAQENNELSIYKYEGQDLALSRDREFGFRLVELAIPEQLPVTLVAKPLVDSGAERRIRFTAPDKEHNGMRFRFRILKGHGVERLLEQRTQSKLEYQLIGAAGVILIAKAAHLRFS